MQKIIKIKGYNYLDWIVILKFLYLFVYINIYIYILDAASPINNLEEYNL